MTQWHSLGELSLQKTSGSMFTIRLLSL